MRDSLTHRGPDDEGIFLAPNRRLGLAHTRLSIIDLSPAGHQPMHDQAGNCIVFNGEIYNYRELTEEVVAGSREQGAGESQRSDVRGQTSEIRGQKSEIESEQSAISHLQYAWTSNSDTEVILRAYAKWGRDCVQRLRGMFAFAIWDEQEKELFLARDSFGIKPLYFYQTSELFLFASELRALLASDLVPRKLSRDGLASYLQFGSCQDPLTIIDGVLSLLPGHCLTVKRHNNRLEVKQLSFQSRLAPDAPTPNGSSYDRLTPNPLTSNGSGSSPFTLRNPPATRTEAVSQLRQILEDSVRHHLVSDVPVGAFLSGGIDSSAIVALMTRVTIGKPKTFTVTFNEDDFSEAAHAQLVAKKFGTEHHEILLPEEKLLAELPIALAAMDRPTMDGINTYVVSKAVKEAGVKVALSGLGGDELFAGYPSFHRAQQMHKLSRMPQSLRRPASAVGRSLLSGSARNRKFWDMVDSDCSPYAAYALSRQLFSSAEIASLLTRGQKSEVSGQRPEFGKSEIRSPKSKIGVPPDADVINAVSRYELSGYMANTLLRDTDQMSMAHALEVRVPFVDPVVVGYVLGLPGVWKMNGGRPKPLLVDALRDLLPEEIWKRRKMGFTLPFQRWLMAGLRMSIAENLLKYDFARLGLNSEQVRLVWESFKENSTNEPWSRPWALYVLSKWCESNGVSA